LSGSVRSLSSSDLDQPARLCPFRLVFFCRHGRRELCAACFKRSRPSRFSAATPAKDEHPIFGGYEVGIGFSGTCDARGALLEASALAGKRSLRLTAVL
jgi:hypothetical protein